MTKKQAAPFGAWASPVGADKVSAAGTSISTLAADGDCLYWLEARPLEGGRSVIVTNGADGQARDVTPEGFNVRTRVHEYGGGAFIVEDGIVYFSNFSDQRLYAQKIGANPAPLTPAPEAAGKVDLRYADAVLDKKRNRLICVREDHRASGEPVNTLVAIDLASGGEGEVLFEGTDFVSSPRLSPDGDTLAFTTWDHPNMPWDVTSLRVAEINDQGHLQPPVELNQPGPGAITQPLWSPVGQLYFIADWSNWWNIYRYENGEGIALHSDEADFAAPAWVFGLSNYVFQSDDQIVSSYTRNGLWYLATLSLGSGKLTEQGKPRAGISSVIKAGNSACFLAQATSAPTRILALTSDNRFETLRQPAAPDLPAASVSRPEPVSFPSASGEVAHGFFYPPANAGYSGPKGDLPPLLVKIHGGPTSATSSAFSFKVQYWTSRGIAVLDLNYRGSTGFGRDFRQKLNRNWGIADVEDATAGATWLADQGRVDPEKLAISGGSAGGLTVLNALAHHDTFSAGGSFYGVSNLEALAQDTHKFEARYCDQLIGLYPEEIEIYRERSPMTAIDKIKTPLLILQGLEDVVVPPGQSESVYDALTQNGVPVAYIPFEGEQHGFRQAKNIERAITAELAFYGQVFGFTPDGEIEPVDIRNADHLK